MRSFCSAKASHIFSTKNIGIFERLTFENLTKCQLTTSLVLNNRALNIISINSQGYLPWRDLNLRLRLVTRNPRNTNPHPAGSLSPCGDSVSISMRPCQSLTNCVAVSSVTTNSGCTSTVVRIPMRKFRGHLIPVKSVWVCWFVYYVW